MKRKFIIIGVLSLLTLEASFASAEDKLDPFFVPRDDFYRERPISGPRSDEQDEKDEKENVESSSPNLVHQIAIDFKDVFTQKENLVIAGVGLGAAWASSYLDETIAESGFNEQVNGGRAPFEAGSLIGSGQFQVAAAFVTYGIGKLASKPGVEIIGRDLVRAQVVSLSLTAALKLATQRERPDGSNNRSFPSGHSSATFATATVLQRHYGWDIGIPAYLVAAYVASSRLYEARHYLSDVVFGAAIGILVGRTITVEIANERVAVSPMVVPAGAGFQLVWLGGGGD